MSYYNQPPRPGPSPTRPLVQSQNSYNDQYQPQHQHPSDYFDPVDSYYSNNSGPPNSGALTGYNNTAQRAVSPSYNNNMATSPSHGRGLQPGDVYPPTSYNSNNNIYTQPGIASRPSFSSQHTDFPDESKSFSSTTHLAAKEYGVGEVIPPLPSNAAHTAAGYAYPPRATPSPGAGGFSNGGPGYATPNPYGAAPPSTPGGWSNWGTSQWQYARNQLLERRVVKQVQLHNGNLVLDVPVPKGVKPQHVGIGEAKGELDSLRYTAATCDPDDFMRKKFTLRQYLYGRKTELFIVMTMYNEDSILLLRTLNSVITNIAHLCSRDRSKTWGRDAWQKVVVCIVADGRKIVNPRVLRVLQLMGVYAEGVAKDTVAGKEVTAHIYEYTSQVVVSESGEVGFGAVPVQMLFCLKEKNAKKLNSHRWFFNAFGPLINPNVCVLLDVGTKPSGTSIYELYKVFEKHANVGGACGEIYADTGKFGKLLWNPIVAGQNFEYKMSNILDKPFESVFGLIAVLPGAFSAYRYAALQNHADGTGPLQAYFHGEMMNLPGAQASIFDRNKFLAEDRILAFEIVTKKNAKWRLQYVKSAKAGTDVPARVPEFISQRRRWLNGSIFAAVYSMACFYRIFTSGHNFFRKCALMLLTIYNLVQLIFNWLSLSSFYLAFFFLISSSIKGASDPFGGAGEEIFQVFNKLYLALIFVVVVCSLGNRPQGSNALYTLCIILFAGCQGLLLYCAGWTVYQTVPHTAAGWTDWRGLLTNRTFVDLAASLMATYGLYLIASLLYFDPWHMLTSFIQYLLLLPSYVNILLIYAFCNLHDVSWGTKGDNGAAKDLGQVKKIEKDGKEIAEVAMPTRQEDVDALWAQARQELRVPEKEVREKRSAETKRSDQDKTFRTNVVLIFLGSNMLVILLFTSSVFTNWINENFEMASSAAFNPYLTVIFWAVLGLSLIRFIGCVLYLVFRLLGH